MMLADINLMGLIHMKHHLLFWGMNRQNSRFLEYTLFHFTLRGIGSPRIQLGRGFPYWSGSGSREAALPGPKSE
jgi:hypothetical protein